MLDAQMTQQLKTYLANLREPIELVASLGDDAKSAQTRELIGEIAALSDLITASFDGDNERRVNARLAELKITRIFVAHRAETIASADRVFELRNGKLKERATAHSAPAIDAAAA